MTSRDTPIWPAWQRVLFRFFFIWFLLQIAPWEWLGPIPGVSFVLGYWYRGVSWAVHAGNARIFHVRDPLVPFNGSGDTSYGWAQLWLFLSLAALGAVIWSALDRKRTSYERPLYWLRTIIRYYLASAALSYGIIKLFATQMAFPTLSQLATPLGDLLPMRLSWLFLGYGVPYQMFAGAMETAAGLLLLFRPTVTAGLLLAMGAFLNVAMINLSYDVPVKIFALHLLFSCAFLLALDSRRLVDFLLRNRGAPPTSAWEPRFDQPWQRWAAIGLKVFIVYQFVIVNFRESWGYYKTDKAPVTGPFRPAVYDVRSYVVGRDTIAPLGMDTLRWNDVIFDNGSAGSVNTRDQMFWQRYRRGYFRYRPDTTLHTLAAWRTSFVPRDSTFLFSMRYEVPDSLTIRLHTVIRGDSVHMELVRSDRHFQLAERQFHWLSEYNR